MSQCFLMFVPSAMLYLMQPDPRRAQDSHKCTPHGQRNSKRRRWVDGKEASAVHGVHHTEKRWSSLFGKEARVIRNRIWQ